MNQSNEKNEVLEEASTLSIRTKKTVAEAFREISNLENISQGDLLEEMIDIYNEEKDENEMKKHKLLVKKINIEDSKTIVFEGKLIYEIPVREVTNIHLNTLKETKTIESYNEDDKVKYSCRVYKTKKNKFLLYEETTQTDYDSVTKLNIFEYEIVENPFELRSLFLGKTYTRETNDVLMLTLEEDTLDI